MRMLVLVACLAMLVIGHSNAQASGDSNKTGRADEAEVQFLLGHVPHVVDVLVLQNIVFSNSLHTL